MTEFLNNIAQSFPEHLSKNMWEWIVFTVLIVLGVIFGAMDKGSKNIKDKMLSIIAFPGIVVMITWIYSIVRTVVALIMSNKVDTAFYATIAVCGFALISIFGAITLIIEKIKNTSKHISYSKDDSGSVGGGCSSNNSSNDMNQRTFDENSRLFQEQVDRDNQQFQ